MGCLEPVNHKNKASNVKSQEDGGDIHLRHAHSEASLSKKFKVHGMKKEKGSYPVFISAVQILLANLLHRLKVK